MATYVSGVRTPFQEGEPAAVQNLTGEVVAQSDPTVPVPGTEYRPFVGQVVPGPEPARHLAQVHYLSDRGGVVSVGRVRQKIRYHAPAIARAVLAAVAVSPLPAIIGAVVSGLSTEVAAVLHRVVILAIAVMWIRAGVKTATAVVRSWLYTVTFHERGLETATGVLHRRKRFIWYYQLTEEPQYMRSPAMFFTHTASLQLTYNDTASTVRDLELAGVGSPSEVEQIRGYLEIRRLAERTAMRGILT